MKRPAIEQPEPTESHALREAHRLAKKYRRSTFSVVKSGGAWFVIENYTKVRPWEIETRRISNGFIIYN